jgi:glycosyltransferase involved in cell wall biosynthesis
MRVHFSNVDFHSPTGPNTFANRLSIALGNKQIEVVPEQDQYDVMLAFIEAASRPAPGTRLVQRLDGIWFKPEEFLEKNANIKATYERADSVIWQSEFDRAMTTAHWGEKQGVVIHNGIDLTITHRLDPQIKKIREKYDRVYVCSANWHRQKRLREVIELFSKTRHQTVSACLLVMGAHPDVRAADPDILYTGSVPHDVCLQIYSVADWMIHLAWLDHCPNVVVEALSQGCPVVCTNSGGTHEIVGDNGIVLDETVSYDLELTDYDNPPPLDLQDVRIPDKIEVNASHLDIRDVADRYIEVMRG